MYGRNPTYQISFILFFAFTFPVAFAPHIGQFVLLKECYEDVARSLTTTLPIAVFLVFRFITGMCGAAFLSVAGGSISDLFTNEQVAT
jgi:MFS family permease